MESYEMAMEVLDVSEAAYAKYFTMMLEGTARTWLKGLPANSIGSWAELKARFDPEFQRYMQAANVDRGFGFLCSS